MSRRSLGRLLIAIAVVVVLRAVAFDRHWLQAAEFILAAAALGSSVWRSSSFPVRGDGSRLQDSVVPTYRLHNTTGDDLGLLGHPAPNVEPAT